MILSINASTCRWLQTVLWINFAWFLHIFTFRIFFCFTVEYNCYNTQIHTFLPMYIRAYVRTYSIVYSKITRIMSL